MKEDQGLVIKYRVFPRWLAPVCLSASVLLGALWVGVQCDEYSRVRYGIEEGYVLPPIARAIRTVFPRPPELEGIRVVEGRTGIEVRGRRQIDPRAIGVTPVGWASQSTFMDVLPGGLGLTPDQVLLGLMALTVLGVLVANISSENKLILKKEGLTFPVGLYAGLIGRTGRQWSDICAIRYMPTKDRKQKSPLNDMRIYFRSGGSVLLKLSRLSQDDLEQFLLALERWGEKCAMPPEMIALLHKVVQKSNSSQSFTSMWEEELRFHFAATNFVPLEAGKALQNSRYKVVMQLAAGGLSAIYLAEYGERVVIIKEAVVPPSTEEKIREKARELFKREAQILLKLDHPQIAKVLDHFVEDGRDYLVLEYIPGRTIREIIKREGPQSEETIANWALQVSGILRYLHNLNPAMVHRDITPDNLVVTPEGQVTLIDFGAANELVGTATGTLIGKQLYMAPEQFRGHAETRSDIYSLGATLFFALTGTEPEALAISSPSAIGLQVSPRIEELINRCTQTEPEHRLCSAEAVIEFLSESNLNDDSGSTIEIKERHLEPVQ